MQAGARARALLGSHEPVRHDVAARLMGAALRGVPDGLPSAVTLQHAILQRWADVSVPGAPTLLLGRRSCLFAGEHADFRMIRLEQAFRSHRFPYPR